jgi:hypothetical protein
VKHVESSRKHEKHHGNFNRTSPLEQQEIPILTRSMKSPQIAHLASGFLMSVLCDTPMLQTASLLGIPFWETHSFVTT